jgi:hypothetical protein
MWQVMELAVPGFKSTNPVQVPLWTVALDILSFCQEHLLYFQLQSKHNMFFSYRTQTNIFLRNIQQSKCADIVTTLQSHVNAYICEDDNGYLPAYLCINGIAASIHLNTLACVRDVAHGLPRVRGAFGDTGYGPWAPSNIVDDAVLPLCVVQGYTPQVYHVDQGWDHVRSSPGVWSYDRAGSAGCGGRDYRLVWASTKTHATSII